MNPRATTESIPKQRPGSSFAPHIGGIEALREHQSTAVQNTNADAFVPAADAR